MSERNRRIVETMNVEMEELNCKRFMEALAEATEKEVNLIRTENGALCYSTTGSALVDFNARATEMRSAAEEVIFDIMEQAYAEDAVKAVKLMFQTGDIRGGKGERRAFNICMDWLVKEHPLVAMEVLTLIPEYTRWDNLVKLTVSDNKEVAEKATEIVMEQLKKDKHALELKNVSGHTEISLLAKWLPSLQTKKAADKIVVRHLLKALHLQEREYRHLLSALREELNVIEKAMSAKEYDKIKMENMTAKQQLRYAAFMKRVMTARRHEYIQAVLRGEAKMNVSVLNPLEILHAYISDSGRWGEWVIENEDYEAMWKLLPDRTSGNGNTLVIRDGSYSMTSSIGQGSSATMLEAATAMAIYCAEHLTGVFKDKFLTFSSCPALIDLSDYKTLAGKIRKLYSYDDCSNTDLEKTFDLILEIAIENHLTQDEIPAYLMILSDMEFDIARGAWEDSDSRDTLFDTIRMRWNEAGYEMPTLVFWQLNGRRTIYPEIDSKNGIIFLSGYSTHELELVMAGDYEAMVEVTEEETIIDEVTGEEKTVLKTRTERVVLTPMEQLDLKLSAERYDAVESAVREGLAKEFCKKVSNA